LSGNDVLDGRQFVDLDAIEGNDQLLRLSERDLICSSPGPTSLAYAFAATIRPILR